MKKIYILLISLAFLKPCFSQNPEDLIDLGFDETAVYAIQTQDKGYAVAGWIDSSNWTIPFIAKFNAQKELIWKKTIWDIDFCRGFDSGTKFIELRDSSLLIVECRYARQSSGDTDIILYNIAANGIFNWSRRYYEERDQRASIIVKTKQNNLIILGSDRPKQDSNVLMIMSVKEDGEILWKKTYASPSGKTTLAYPTEVKENDNGELYISWNVSNKGIISKLAKGGELIWHKTIDMPLESTVFGLTLTSDNHLAICADGDRSGYIKKLDAEGNEIFSVSSKYKKFTAADDILEINNNTLVAIGFAQGIVNVNNDLKFWLFATDLNGNIVKDTIWEYGGDDQLFSAMPFDSNHILLAGSTFNGENQDIYLSLFDFASLLTTSTKYKDIDDNLYLYPNPVNDLLRLDSKKNYVASNTTLEIIDVVGKNVFSKKIDSLPISLDLSSYASGFYTITVRENNQIVFARKIVKN